MTKVYLGLFRFLVGIIFVLGVACMGILPAHADFGDDFKEKEIYPFNNGYLAGLKK